MMSDILTAGGNGAMASAALLCAYLAATRHPRMASSWARMTILGAALATGAVALRIGMWVLAIWTRPEGARYAAWVFEVRDEITIISALAFVGGCSLIVAALSRSHHLWRAVAAVASVSLAAGLFSAFMAA